MEIPCWMNEQFLQAALEASGDETVDPGTLRFTARPAAPHALNILSGTFRVHVQFHTKQGDGCSKHLILKCPNPESQVTQDLEKVNFFDREPMIYEILLPQMYKKLKASFGPKFYSCAVKDALLLDDLAKDGYLTSDPQGKLDLAHCKEVFKKIAKFHATSVSCYNENPNLFEPLTSHVVFTDEGPLKDQTEMVIKQSVSNMIKVLSHSNGLDSFKHFLSQRVETIWKGATESCKRKSVGLNVLNHGDLWTSNILFNYSGQEIADVKLIDYQLTHVSSPVNDLLWFIWTSAAEDVVTNHLDQLYDVYLQTLNSTLALLVCPQTFTKQQLESDIKAAIDYVLLIIAHQLPIFMGTEIPESGETLLTQEKDSETHVGSKNVFEKYYKGKYYCSILPSVCKQFEKHFL